MLDVVFINPGNSEKIYQSLSKDFTAIETPTWSLLLAQSMRYFGFKPSIFDVNAERLSISDAVKRLRNMKARLFCFVVLCMFYSIRFY